MLQPKRVGGVGVSTRFDSDLSDLIRSFHESRAPSFKVTSYFPAYVELLAHLRGTECTFVETGVLNGGSLFMWRSWLGPKARIIGCDLNPDAAKWRDSGFEILIGDQGDPEFWHGAFAKIGHFDAFLDDGGHQSFQQIITLQSAIAAASGRAVIVIEDTCTSFMKHFDAHGDRTFLSYAKASTDVLTARMAHFFPDEFPDNINKAVMDVFGKVVSVHFYAGLVAYRVDRERPPPPALIWSSKPKHPATDFRYRGVSSAVVEWPEPFSKASVLVKGREV